MDTINTNQIEIGGKLLNIEPKKLNGNVQINLTGDVSGSIDTPIEAGKTITIETRVEGGTGGGIPEAPIDDKQYARKNAGWVEVEGGGGASAFKAIYGTTSYAEVLAAINADSIVICDVSGYIYQYVNKDSTKIVFALTEKNSSGNVMNETVWVNSDDTWDGEAIRVAKHSEVPTLTSQLTNDAGFSKVVVGNAPPAAGTPDDTITLILGGAGGAGEYGAWELIGEGTGLSMGDTISLSKNVSSFDFIVANAISNGGGNISHIYPVHSLIYGTSAFILNGSNNQLNLLVYDNYLYVATAGIPNVKLYGINLKGSKKDESISFKQGLYGGYERENTPSLPSGYTKKYAIKNSGCSLLDTGLVFGDVNDWCLATSLGSHITGARYDGLMSNDYSNESTNMVRLITYSTNSGILYNSDSTAGSTSTGTWWKDGVITMGRNRGTRFAKIDFNTNVLGNNSDGISNTSTFKLWSNTNANTVAEIKFFCAEINREKVADYVACIRNSDNCPGFYDFVSGTFKTSAAGGSDLIAVD